MKMIIKIGSKFELTFDIPIAVISAVVVALAS